MRYIVVDLEATCWEGNPQRQREEREIIEIGAVRLSEDFVILDDFGSFVRPVVNPRLSHFCTELTTITQADIDSAEPFAEVFAKFLSWIGDGPHRLCSWGLYDLTQFRENCTRFDVELPAWFETGHVNVKTAFAAWKGTKPGGMDKAMALLGLTLEGVHHRGIDDARNIARIAGQLLPHVDLAERGKRRPR